MLPVLKLLVIPSSPSTQEEQSSIAPQLALPSAPTQDSTTVSPQVLQGICQAVAALPTNQLFDASGPLSNDGAV